MDAMGTSQKLNGVINQQSQCETESLKSHAVFSGRKLFKYTGMIWRFTHNAVHLTPCVIGFAIGGALGLVGGTVYKIYKNARGESADTRCISAYAIKSAKTAYRFVQTWLDQPLVPVSPVLTVPLVFAGMTVALVGVVVSAVACTIYKGFKHAIGEGAETKKLSEYAIHLLDFATHLYVFGAAAVGILGSTALIYLYPGTFFYLWLYLCVTGVPMAFVREYEGWKETFM